MSYTIKKNQEVQRWVKPSAVLIARSFLILKHLIIL